MSCNCNKPTPQSPCQAGCSSQSIPSCLTFKIDETNLVPYQGLVPMAPIDLTELVQAAETNTRLRLDIEGAALEYSNEKSLSGDDTPDTILLETISKQIPLSGLKDVSQNAVSGGDLLVFNIQTQLWEPISVNDDDLVSVVGYNAAGRLSRGDAGSGGGGGATLSSASPLFKTTANTALAYDVSAALSTVYISVSGFQSKAG